MMFPKQIFFVGIGGIGMSALARFFHAKGHMVAGYDKSDSELIQALRTEGLKILLEDDVNALPDMASSLDTLVVRTPAVPEDTAILKYFMKRGNVLMKRSELLAKVSQEMRTIAVAGTHGKTTTSSMIAHLLRHSGMGCTAFIGGVMSGYETNVLIDSEAEFMVLEADEFDRSFHHLKPEIAVITSVDPDHLDVYGDEAGFREAFRTFARRLEEEGTIIRAEEVPAFDTGFKEVNYGVGAVNLKVENIHIRDGAFFFDLNLVEGRMDDLCLHLLGRHNIMNATAAVAVGLELGMSHAAIRAGLDSYEGVRRRFQIHQRGPKVHLVDDYAHHPNEIKACLQAARELFPEKVLTVVFQPHLFSRTRDFMDDFAQSLSLADELILLPIYPARELPIEGVTSQRLLELTTVANTLLCTKEELPTHIAERELEVLLILGAGDIDRTIPLINSVLSKRNQNH